MFEAKKSLGAPKNLDMIIVILCHSPSIIGAFGSKSTLCTQEMKNAYLIQMHRKEEKMMRAREDEALGGHKNLGAHGAHLVKFLRFC